MDNFEWRPRARFVAYAEQVLFAIAFPASIVISLLDCNNVSNGVEGTTEREKRVEELVTEIFGGRDGMLLIILLKEELIVLLIVIGLCATLKLLRATSLRRLDLKEVIRQCEFWRNVNLFFLLVTFIELFLFLSYVYLVIELIVIVLLLVFLYIVAMFMREVKTVVNHVPVNSSGFDTI